MYLIKDYWWSFNGSLKHIFNITKITDGELSLLASTIPFCNDADRINEEG